MNKTQFIEALRSPVFLNESTLEQIKETLEEYPFFQAGRMLWLKNLHILDHIRFNNELKLGAAHIADRSKLFELIHKKLYVKETSVVESNIKKVDEINISDVIEDLNDNVVLSDKLIIETAETKISDNERASVDINYFDVDDVFETGTGSKLDFSAVSSQREPVDIGAKAFDSDTENMVLPSADLLDYERKNSTGYALSDDITEIKPDESRSFSDWLNVLKQQPKVVLSEIKEDDFPEDKNKKMSLIDSFLQKAPKGKIKPLSKEATMTKNVDISAKSLEERDDLMTETLADIYIKQKHFFKAIEILERLSLKYPEKNIYFVRRIKELEEQINNQ
jgi:hypothetical protein